MQYIEVRTRQRPPPIANERLHAAMNTDINQPFASYENTLWRVLAALARDGYVSPPDEARDVIHDFFVDAWAGVNHRYEENRGTFKTYLVSAFYRFARRRIIYLNEASRRLADLELVEEIPSDESSAEETIEKKEGEAKLRDAMAVLPAFERRLLYDYLSDIQQSERYLAKKYEITRHGLRKTLIEAIGKLATEIQGRTASGLSAKVAHMIWQDGLTPRQVADRLGISPAEATSLKNRFATGLLASTRSSKINSDGMAFEMSNILDEFKSLLLSPNDQLKLDSLAARSEEIKKLLVEPALDLALTRNERAAIEEHSEWIAVIYSQLASAGDGPAEEEESTFSSIRMNEEFQVASAFNSLVSVLPKELVNWRAWFSSLGEVDRETAELLDDEITVYMGGVEVAKLAAYGITPAAINSATRNISTLLKDAQKKRRSSKHVQHVNKDFPLVKLDCGDSDIVINQHLLVRRVAMSSGMVRHAAPVLTQWIFAASEFLPYFIDGFHCRIVRAELVFTPVHDERPLFFRWTTTSYKDHTDALVA